MAGKVLKASKHKAVVEAALEQALLDKKKKEEAEKVKHIVPINNNGLVYLMAANTGDRILVDLDIYWQFYKLKVSICPNSYVCIGTKYLHHIICPLEEGDNVIDHISRNKLDNRRANLQSATHMQNIRHRVPYGKPQYDRGQQTLSIPCSVSQAKE